MRRVESSRAEMRAETVLAGLGWVRLDPARCVSWRVCGNEA